MLKSVFGAALLATSCLAAPLAAQEAATTTATAEKDQAPMHLSIERVFASPSLNGQAPRGVKLSPDGKYLTLLRNRADDKYRYDLWGYDRATGQWSMLVDSEKLGTGRELSEAEKMQRERARVGSLKGIITYSWAPDGKAILIPLDGDLYLAKPDGTTTRLTDSPEGELNPALSETGRYLSFVRDGRVFVGPVGGAAPAAITPAEADETVSWGVAEFASQEEFDRLAGYWWSPDDRRIAVQRTDEARVAIVTRTAIGAEETTVTEQRYPAAGTDNALVQLFVMDPDGGNKVQVDLGANDDIYLGRVDWAKDGKTLFVQRINRVQDRLDMLSVDAATGKSRLLFSENAAKGHWINLTDNYRVLDDGSLIWWSERSGYGHLYRYKSGKFQPLTKGDWVVTDLVGVDQEKGKLFFAATKDDPLAQQVYSLDYTKPGTPRLLTDTAFANGAGMDKQGKALLIYRSSVTQPSQLYLADQDGKRQLWVEENRVEGDHPYAPFMASHRPTEYGTLKAADGQTLYWRMIKPEMEPGKRYPVFFEHYGGPHAQTVTRGWQGGLDQALVDAGYIVFEIDNRGSYNRGVAFEKPIYRAMGTVEVEDQKLGAEYLKTLPFVDPDKIATYGWSYGGYMTLKMLEADPGLYAAGISGAPVSKWELYDTAYTERYMGDPRTDKAAYDKSSTLGDAGKIADPLLLIHGMSDDNVVFSNATSMATALQENNVPFEMMFYPGETHSAGGGKRAVHVWHTILRFLESHGVTPPE